MQGNIVNGISMAILIESNSKTLEELKAEFDEFLSSISDDIYSKELRKVHGKSTTIDKVGDLPYLCFNYFRSEDKETYDKLTKPLCQDPEADPLSIRYNIGYYNSVENIRVNLFFDDIASQADWGFKKAFKINNHYYFIHNKSFHANNLLQFARYIYVESDGKYLVKLSDNFPEEPSVGLWLVSEKKQKRSSKAVQEVEETDAEIDKYDIFVSYSRADYNLVHPLVKEIEDMGVKVWFDMNGIESGDAFKKKIMKAIENSDSLLFMYSKNTINSEYTEKEVNYAKGLDKKIRPVLINGEIPKTGWFAFDYSHLDIINIQDHLQKEKLLKNLRDAYCNAEEPKHTDKNTKAKKLHPYNVTYNELNPYLPEYIYFPMSNAPAMYFQKIGSKYRLEKERYFDSVKAYSKMSEPEKKLLSTGKSIGESIVAGVIFPAASLILPGMDNYFWFKPFKDKYEELDQKVKVMCDSIGLVVKVTEKYYILDVFRSPENRAYLAERCMPAIWPDNK